MQALRKALMLKSARDVPVFGFLSLPFFFPFLLLHALCPPWYTPTLNQPFPPLPLYSVTGKSSTSIYPPMGT